MNILPSPADSPLLYEKKIFNSCFFLEMLFYCTGLERLMTNLIFKLFLDLYIFIYIMNNNLLQRQSFTYQFINRKYKFEVLTPTKKLSSHTWFGKK